MTTNPAAAFLHQYAMRTRKPGETAAEARERARAELPTLARLAGEDRERETLRLARAI